MSTPKHRKCPYCGVKGRANGTKHATDSFSVRHYRGECGHTWTVKIEPARIIVIADPKRT